MLSRRHLGLRCACRARRARGLCRMPPAPHVMSALYMEYRRKAKPGVTVSEYLVEVGFVDPSITAGGMDDRLVALPAAGGGVELLSLPEKQVTGTLRVIVLLVDFADKKGYLDAGHYEDL